MVIHHIWDLYINISLYQVIFMDIWLTFPWQWHFSWHFQTFKWNVIFLLLSTNSKCKWPPFTYKVATHTRYQNSPTFPWPFPDLSAFFPDQSNLQILRYLHIYMMTYLNNHFVHALYTFQIANLCLFVCLFGFNVALKHLRSYHDGACSSGTLTNVLPHRNAMPQTQDMTPHPVIVYRHGANLSLCYPLMWTVTLEYTATHFSVLGETRPGNPSPTFHTQQRTLYLMLSWWSTVGSSVESTVPTGSWTRDLWCANPVCYPLAHSDFLKSLWTKTNLEWSVLKNMMRAAKARTEKFWIC